MSDPDTQLERRARELLQASAQNLDAATRSKLTQARHAALEARNTRRAPGWLPHGWMAPTGASFAALLVAMVVIHLDRPGVQNSASGGEDLELLADADALELTDTPDYDFYEWAIAQAAEDGNVTAGT